MENFPLFSGFLHPVISFIVSLSIIVFVHEYGHYIVGKWTGIKADVFSVGMGPVVMSRVDKNGTTWQLAAIPFGGFVKFKGDANISSSQAEYCTNYFIKCEDSAGHWVSNIHFPLNYGIVSVISICLIIIQMRKNI